MTSLTRSNLPIGLAAIAGLLLAASPAAAQGVDSPQDQKLDVTASVAESCTVTAASLEFGEFDRSAQVLASGAIEISCVTESTFGVELDGGLSGGGEAGVRFMAGGGNPLQYILYSDAPGSDPWEVGEAVPVTITGNGSVPVHGMIPQQADGQSPGEHSDEVTITLVF